MPTVTLPDGQTVEVSLDAIAFNDGEVPQGFVSTEKLQSEVQRRVSAAKRNARTDLLQDDEFWREAATARGIELREDLMPKGASKDDAAALERFKAQYVTPLQAKLTEAEQAVERYRARALEADILQAAAEAGVKDAFLKPIGSGPAPLVQMVRDAFVYDEESDVWALKSDNGVRYGDDGRPAGAKTLLAELKQNEAYQDYFKSSKMNGSGHSGQTGNPGGRVYSTAEIAAMSLDEFEKHADDIAAAQREGRIRD